MRKVHIGENKWEDFDEEEDEVQQQQPTQPVHQNLPQTTSSTRPLQSNIRNTTPQQNTSNAIRQTLLKYSTPKEPTPNNISNKDQLSVPQVSLAEWRASNLKTGSQYTSNTVTPSKDSAKLQPQPNLNKTVDKSNISDYQDFDQEIDNEIIEEIPNDILREYFPENMEDLDNYDVPNDFDIPDEMEEEPMHEVKKVKKTQDS